MRLGRWEIFRRIKPYARESRWLIVVMLLCSAAAVPVSLVNPVFFQILIDDVMPGAPDRGVFTRWSWGCWRCISAACCWEPWSWG